MSRNNILPAMKEAIRRRCGYGCIVCGLPIIEYHHIYGYDKTVGHIESEITLLCESCHRKEQNGLIPQEEVIRYDANPFNWLKGESTPERVWYSRHAIKVNLGSNTINVTPLGDIDFYPILLDGHAVLALYREEGAWLLSIDLRDPWHRPYLQIDKNNLVFKVSDCDVSYSAGIIKILNQEETIFEASFKAPVLSISRAYFFGTEFQYASTKRRWFCLTQAL